jgi:hypothetical protein
MHTSSTYSNPIFVSDMALLNGILNLLLQLRRYPIIPIKVIKTIVDRILDTLNLCGGDASPLIDVRKGPTQLCLKVATYQCFQLQL